MSETKARVHTRTYTHIHTRARVIVVVVGAFETRHCSIRGSSIAQFHRIRVNVPTRLRYRNPFAERSIDRSYVVIDRVRNFFFLFFFFFFIETWPVSNTWPQGGPSVGYLIWRTEVALCGRKRYAFERSSCCSYFDNDVRDCIFEPNIFLPHFSLERVPFEEVFNA